ncbi:MAG: dephospho-CoA kinase [Pseudomonadota bacterium]
MLRVGLTGGIGSGKSLVAKLFRGMQIPVIEADNLAKNLTMPGKIAFEEIKERFGHDILSDSGEINREKLRQEIFTNEDSRKTVESILHPKIMKEIRLWFKEQKQLNQKSAVAVVPLLIEANLQAEFDKIITVECKEKYQIQRVINRDNCTASDVKKIISSQANRKDRIKFSDHVIENNDSIEFLNRETEKINKILSSE